MSVTLVAGGVLSGASYLRAWTKGAALDRSSIATFELLVTKILDPLDAKRRIELAVDALVRSHNGTTVAVADLGIFSPVGQVQSVIVPSGVDSLLEGVDVRLVTREFFDIMRVPLKEGRWPTATEWQEEAAVVIITETAAEVMWPGHSAVGQTLVPLRASQQTISRPVTVIAVVADQRYGALDAQTTGTIFLPNPLRLNSVGAVLIAKTPGPADGFLEMMGASLSGVDGVRVTRSSTLGDVLFDSIRHRAFPAWLFGWFGIVAFAILASGIMGTVSMSVARYRPEIGVRLALGASPQRIVWRLVRDRLAIIFGGCFVGWLLSLWLAKYVDVHLYGISSMQASVWMSIAIGAGIVTGVAALVPARRVFRIDPASLLRELR